MSQITHKKKPLISKSEILQTMYICLLSEKSLKTKRWENSLDGKQNQKGRITIMGAGFIV